MARLPAMAAPLRAFLALVLLCFAATIATAQPAPVPGTLEPLTIVTAKSRHAFLVEVARTDADRAQGLMYRRMLAPDQGMLFDFARTDIVTMWMQNTYISLDMIFIRADGTIARIAQDTEPLSTRTISSGEPVLSVLEVAAGTTRRLGIKPGDKVENPLFRP
jgi:uncharacterized membrane protein (UPF0127 family)